MVVKLDDFKAALENKNITQLEQLISTITFDYDPADNRKERAKKYSSVWPGVSHGQRNSEAYRHAAQLREKFDLYEQDVAELICNWNRLNNPPLPDDELTKAISNADKYAKKPAGSGYNTNRKNLAGDMKQLYSPSDHWPELVKFDETVLPKFPLTQTPPCLRGFYAIVDEIAKSVQVAPDMPALILLSVIASALSGTVKVLTNNHYGELANLYVVVFSPSGTRKSHVFNILSKPLFDYQKQLRNEMAPEIEKNKSEKKLLEGRKTALEKEIIKAGDCDDNPLKDELNEVTSKLASFDKPVTSPTLIASDTTIEAMAMCMANNNGRLSILDHEGIFFNNISGRYKGSGEMPSNDLILKAYSGDTYSDHRLTRESVYIDKPVLSIGLCVQPTVIEHLRHKEFLNETGLLPRFIAAMPRDTVGQRQAKTPNIAHYILEDYDKTIAELLKLREKNVENVIKFDSDADEMFVNFFEDIEKRMAEDGDLYIIRPWAAKLCGHVARIAAVLHCFADPTLESTNINGDVMQFAVKIGYYLIDHIKAIYQTMNFDLSLNIAKKIISWIRRHEKDTFTKTEVFNAMKNSDKSIQKASDFAEPMELLQQQGYIRQLQPEQKNGRPSEIYQVNPEFYK